VGIDFLLLFTPTLSLSLFFGSFFLSFFLFFPSAEKLDRKSFFNRLGIACYC